MTADNDERLEKFKAILSMENQVLYFDPDTRELLELFEQMNENSQEYLDAYIALMAKMGLCAVWAYFCKRCNYVWIPRDFDPLTKHVFGGGQNIFHKNPPKCCARCKSRYWNKSPQRKTKHTPNPKEGMYGHDMLTKPRMQALRRNTQKGKQIMSEKLAEIEKIEKEFHKKMEQVGIKEKKPIEIISLKRKKKIPIYT